MSLFGSGDIAAIRLHPGCGFFYAQVEILFPCASGKSSGESEKPISVRERQIER